METDFDTNKDGFQNTLQEGDDFWAMFRPKVEGRSLLYRFEWDGIIVYDSRARISDEEAETHDHNLSPPRMISSFIHKEIQTAKEYDRLQYLNMKNYTPFRQWPVEYTLVIPTESTLRFNSKFESGNLRKAIKVSEDEYNLLLDYDVETQGYTQWFYFSVENYKANHKVRFNIINLMKYDSLYNNGMKPLVYSLKEESSTGINWYRDGTCISYFQNNIPRTHNFPDSKVPNYYYTLTFTYTFKHSDDIVYFAHCFPYTYTDLTKYLKNYTDDARFLHILRVDTLCKTLAGNPCPVLTITENIGSYTPWIEELSKLQKSTAGRKMMRQRELRVESKLRILEQVKHIKIVEEKEHCRKKGVILTARVHPGETNSSYMMKGAIDFLLSDSKEAKTLRSKFIFKIIPMLNPDGVIYGNYRCGLLGVDLNRRWKKPNKYLHPTVFYTKKLAQVFSEEHEVIMYCDMHGHSMKKNVFMYACKSKGGYDDAKTNVFIRLFPYLLSRRNPIFSYKDSHFRLEKCKESTARIVIYKECGILNSFTLEASFFGPSSSTALDRSSPDILESPCDSHMGIFHLESLGRDLCKQLSIFLSPVAFRKKIDEVGRSMGCSYLNRRSRPTISSSPSKSAKLIEDSEELAQSTVDLIEKGIIDHMHIIKEEEEIEEFDIGDVIKEVDEDLLEPLTIQCETDRSDTETDSSASDNDDKRIEYLIKRKKVKKPKNEENKSKEPENPFKIASEIKVRPPSAQLKRCSLSPNGKLKKEHRHQRYSTKSSHCTLTRKGSLHLASFLRAPLAPDQINMISPYKLEDSNSDFQAEMKPNPIARVTQASGGFRKLTITKDRDPRIPKDRGFIITALGESPNKEVNGKVIYKSIIEKTREQTSLLMKSNKSRRNRRQTSSTDQSNLTFEVSNRHYDPKNLAYNIIH